MNLYEWARRWDVDVHAVYELRQMMGISPDTLAQSSETLVSEAGVSKHERLKIAQAGGVLWRNNVGAMQDDSGRVVRYGIANDSSALNARVKSSDLIGIKPVYIHEGMVGLTIGQFVARETKAPGWQYTGKPREKAQLKFIELVIGLGGDARFSTGE